MNITSRQLKAFLLTARHQSFSRAAEQLFITQSGMSVLIRELEDQLGFRLFDRTTRRVTLTEFGTRFLPIADRSVLELETAAANIGRSASVAGRRLTVGAMPLLAGRLLPAVIGEHARRDPGLEIVLRDAPRARLIEMVASGELDVALGSFLDPMPGVRRVSLHRFSMMAIQNHGDAQRLGRPLRWHDLVDARLIGMPAESPVQQLVERSLAPFGRREPPELVFNYMETILAMVAVGAGVAVVPSLCAPACRAERIAMSPLTDPVVPMDLYEIHDRGRKLPRGADEFIDFLKSYIARWSEPAPSDVARAA